MKMVLPLLVVIAGSFLIIKLEKVINIHARTIGIAGWRMSVYSICFVLWIIAILKTLPA